MIAVISRRPKPLGRDALKLQCDRLNFGLTGYPEVGEFAESFPVENS